MEVGEWLAGRYRLESELGRGGMAIAYAARDTVRGTSVALKRLQPKAAHGPLAHLFEREFYTLKQLSHPRIVRVHDFAYDDDGTAFYTMEWLGGGDLDELSPLPYARVCALLCDVASALSLLHSRHLVHRDVTTRNIRCGDDGHAKLIDFGAVAAFGTTPRVVGTPPFCAPEAVHGQELDGRVDLFALGAAAYLALTGRHAYPARSLDRLRERWRSVPRPPSHYVPEIPKALDALVMSLLSLDRNARPTSATEVMERLGTIGDVDLSEQVIVQEAYLTSPRLVGRNDEVQEIRRLIGRALKGRGAGLLVRARAGMGRSRMAATCVLEGKLLGAAVARADASDATQPFGVVRALCGELAEALPELLDALDPRLHAVVLPADSAQASEQATLDLPAPQRVQAFQAFLFAAANRRPVVLVVDDAHRIDQRSAALLGLVTEAVARRRMLVVATVLDGPLSADAPLSFFADKARTLELDPLDEEAAQSLLGSVFGNVPHLSMLTRRLHAIAAGCPGTLMQLAQHLLERKLVQYEAGAWTLPAALDPADVPSSIQAALSAKLQRLSPPALLLSQALGLADGSVGADELPALMGDAGPGQALSAADELVSLGVAHVSGVRYQLASPSYRAVLDETLSPSLRASLHGRLSELHRKRSARSWFVPRHLHLAGRDDEAIDLLLEHSPFTDDLDETAQRSRELPSDWQQHFRALLDYAETTHRPARDRYVLRSHLVAYAVLRGETGRHDVEVLLRTLEHACGRDLYDTLDPSLPAAERLTKTFELAQARYEHTPEHERVKPPGEALPELARTVLRAIGVIGSHNDFPFFEQLRALEPFAPLAPSLQVIQWNVEATRALSCGRLHALHALNERMLARLDEPDGAGLNPVARRYMSLALKFSACSAAATFGRAIDEQRLRDMDADPVFAINACHVRMLASLAIGDTLGADEHRRAAERLRLQDNPPQMFEGVSLTREASVYAFAGDLARLKQLMPELERTAGERPGWRPTWYHTLGSYHQLRGALSEALEAFERGLSLVQAGTHVHFCALAAARARVLLELDEAAQALPLCLSDLAAARAADLGPSTHALLSAAALVHSALGQHDEARALSEEAIACLTEFEAGGLVLGSAHEARAWVAIAESDEAAFEEHARTCARIYRAGHNALLAARYAALMAHASARRIAVSAELADAAASSLAQTLQDLTTQVDDPEERARLALQGLLRACDSESGYLYIVKVGGPELCAQIGDRLPPRNVDQLVIEHLRLEADDALTAATQTCAVADDDDEGDLGVTDWSADDGGVYQPVLLSHPEGRGVAITGLALLRCDAGAKAPPGQFVAAISRALHEAGDVTTMLAG